MRNVAMYCMCKMHEHMYKTKQPAYAWRSMHDCMNLVEFLPDKCVRSTKKHCLAERCTAKAAGECQNLDRKKHSCLQYLESLEEIHWLPFAKAFLSCLTSQYQKPKGNPWIIFLALFLFYHVFIIQNLTSSN